MSEKLVPEARTPAPSGMKPCSKCRVYQPLSNFYPNAKMGDGHGSWCKACYKANYEATKTRRAVLKHDRRKADVEAARAESRAYYAANSERILANQRARNYGVSAEQYAEMVARSGGRCESCGGPPTKRGLVIDHDHDTGAVRGLLCSKCNTGLGQFNDDPARLRAAAEYLETHQEARFLPEGSPHDALEEQVVVQVNSTREEGL